jgi:hypothetical protein
MTESTDATFGETSPPTAPEPLGDPDAPKKWPTVVGWLSIIFGSLSLTCLGTISILSIFMQAMLMSLIAQDPSITNPPPTPQVPLGMVMLTFLSVAWQVPLIMAGIAAVLRKPASRPLHLLFAVGYSITYFVAQILAVQFQQDWLKSPEMVTWLAENSQSKAAQGLGAGPNFPVIIATGLVILAWPTFCLIWFLPAHRSEIALRRDEEDALV